jgi:hypothetical protein
MVDAAINGLDPIEGEGQRCEEQRRTDEKLLQE